MSHNQSAASADENNNSELIDRIGQLTRALHDSMRELGLDKEVEKAAEAIPDARDRLAYIAETTEAAAERALSAIEVAQPMQERLAENAQSLSSRWDTWFDAPIDLSDARELVADTRGYLRHLPEQTRATNAQLHEIMMAQDFQDLTGQVVGKLITVIRRIESQLVEVLVEHMPEAASYRERREADIDGDSGDGLLNGPQVNAAGKSDVVTDQAQVDDLLEELGF
ncbi:protein phosphatase CheZ [Salinisphaera hydrothermalis]|uniref:Protein phosphatase CheZ n=1 Tax=Salinisphaera hydrothermalis (strain C41B8) TaxID=1304275 RepID=A0A084IMV8_SALHC|nr:protein phosphatase CheZ [Salinisphaera hydrothermalis]KEZ78042.1 chemotaxis regulator CheZ [Salinisphaera hydrothermalis C41B8]